MHHHLWVDVMEAPCISSGCTVWPYFDLFASYPRNICGPFEISKCACKRKERVERGECFARNVSFSNVCSAKVLLRLGPRKLFLYTFFCSSFSLWPFCFFRHFVDLTLSSFTLIHIQSIGAHSLSSLPFSIGSFVCMLFYWKTCIYMTHYTVNSGITHSWVWFKIRRRKMFRMWVQFMLNSD